MISIKKTLANYEVLTVVAFTPVLGMHTCRRHMKMDLLLGNNSEFWQS